MEEHKAAEQVEQKQNADTKHKLSGMTQDVRSAAAQAGEWLKDKASDLAHAVSSSSSSSSGSGSQEGASGQLQPGQVRVTGRNGERPADEEAARRIQLPELLSPLLRKTAGASAAEPKHVDEIPREKWPDNSVTLLREGNLFGIHRFLSHGTDLFRTRLMGSNVIFVYGEDAAKMLYVPDRMTRVGTLPPQTLRLLQTSSSIAALDAEVLRHRKRLWMSVMPPAMTELVQQFEQEWKRQVEHKWAARSSEKPVDLETLASEVLCRAVCDWAGVPLEDSELEQRARELVAMYDCSASAGPRMWLAMSRRRSSEKWIRGLVQRIRSGEFTPRPGSALEAFANHCDHANISNGNGGQLMRDEDLVAEILNLIRPVTAVARWILFAGLALRDFPHVAEKIRTAAKLRQSGSQGSKADSPLPSGSTLAAHDPALSTPPQSHTDADYPLWAAQEIRRFYPFFPLLSGIAREAFVWRGMTFAKGDWFVFDVNATHRDGRSWENPTEFQPERFREWSYAQASFLFLPQGGGEFLTGHRCPGDNLAAQLTASALRLLASDMEYQLEDGQDLSVDLARIPARPNNGMRMQNIRLKQ